MAFPKARIDEELGNPHASSERLMNAAKLDMQRSNSADGIKVVTGPSSIARCKRERSGKSKNTHSAVKFGWPPGSYLIETRLHG
jgi:hypothetical protein